MKTISIFLVSLLFGFLTIAQDETHDPKAREVLDKVSDKTSAYTSVKASFSYTLESEQDKTSDTHEGDFLKKGNKYRINLMGSVVYYNGETQWTHLKDADEVQITVPDMSEENILNPNYIFDFYKKGFKYRYNGEVSEAGKNLHEIDLFPEQPKGKQYTRIRLKIDKSKNDIYSIKVFGRDGT
ncbi:MAG: outer membrane lipoprotein carrier protein LolA, partial [Bacteroidetes bacterium]|nr:outer membrane lipoprotein carrier protein LolA [Bacteroidota bacterium]